MGLSGCVLGGAPPIAASRASNLHSQQLLPRHGAIAVHDAGTCVTLLVGRTRRHPSYRRPHWRWCYCRLRARLELSQRLPIELSSNVSPTLANPTSNCQAYNSDFNSDPNPPRLIGNFPLLPLRTKTRGPAYVLPFPSPPLPAYESPEIESESYDILDEVLRLFRANTFFRNFEIKGPADRLLVYGIWFVSDCLTKIKPNAIARDAAKEVNNLALDLNFAIPGDPAFPLNQVRLFSYG